MKVFFKKLFKSEYFQEILSWMLYGYLYVVSVTSSKKFIFEGGFDLVKFHNPKRYIFVLWHNELAVCTIFFKKIGRKIRPLVSPHSDGMILAKIIEKYGCKNIYGSTNKNSTKAVREIIETIKKDGNIIITPDGPKGPVFEINSNITDISNKYGGTIIPVSLNVNRSYELKTWDRMLVPLPFSEITIKFGKPFENGVTMEELKKSLGK